MHFSTCLACLLWLPFLALASEAHSLADLAAKATTADAGRSASITSTADGALLSCGFQKLEGRVTPDGLKIVSTEQNEAFGLSPHVLGREETTDISHPGHVQASQQLVQLVRPALTEEYSVSTEGLRQDFVLHERPEGFGPLRLTLKIEGAACESTEQGVKLTLAGSGREIAYHKLKVTDARGREHAATMQPASTSMIEIVVADEAAAYPLRIDPTLSDADWVSLNNDLLGTDVSINCFADDGAGNLYAGGRFTRIGGITTRNIARWDGTRWWPVGSGIEGGELGNVACLAFGNGNLYAGGSFTSAGGVPVSRIARWDGASWHALGSGLNGAPLAIAVNGADVFIGGTFSQAGGVSVSNIARWNGTTWASMGAGCNGALKSLLMHGGLLYAGGSFTTAGGISASRVASWDGLTWSAVGGGAAGEVKCLLAFQGVLMAGGQSGVASWNGSAWTSLGFSSVSYLATDGTYLYYPNTSLILPKIYRYDPGGNEEEIGELVSSWSSPYITSFGFFQGELYVSGQSFREVRRYDPTTSNTKYAIVSNLARWNGTEWKPVSKNINNTVSCMASENGQVVIGGSFTTAGGTNARRVALWNGTSWQALGNGLDKTVIAIAKHGADVYAAEIVENIWFDLTTCRVQHWNGSSWQMLGDVFDNRIQALLWHNGSLYAAGSFFSIGDDERVKIARWNGAQWEQVGDGIPLLGNPVRAMVSMGNDLYVGGYGVAKWNGQAWSTLPGEMDGDVYSLEVHEGQLVAGGNFLTISGISVRGLARWNGTRWSAFPSWPGYPVRSLAAHGTELYVASEFGTPSYSVFPLQQWNGSTWKTSDFQFSQPGERITSNVISSMVAPGPGKLWIGGYFEQLWRATNYTHSPFLIQANIPGSTLSTQETWRQTHFGTYNNSGSGADTADYDEDGLSNLLEYALGQNPTQGVSRAMPVPQVSGSNYVISFTQPAGVSGVTYGAEWSASLAPGSWTAIPDTGTSPQHTFSVPLNGKSRVFVRLKITTP